MGKSTELQDSERRKKNELWKNSAEYDLAERIPDSASDAREKAVQEANAYWESPRGTQAKIRADVGLPPIENN